jgi:phage tail tape-measure protein
MAQHKRRAEEQGIETHPLGTVAGVAAGAAAGAVSGIAAGPVGSLAGAVGGAALAGAATAAGSQTAAGDTDSAPLAEQLRHEAREYGARARRRLGPGAEWSDAEPTLRDHWAHMETPKRPTWEQARNAVHEGWDREA